jgi:GTP-binding protein Era
MTNSDQFHSGFVLLWGRPNVGKSTLLNAALGRKVAIVTPKPQTTRNRIAGVRTTEDAQMIFVDTPGIHPPHDTLGEYMVATAREALPDADVVLFLVDASVPPGPADEQAARLLASATAPRVLVLNKRDLVAPDLLAQRQQSYEALGSFEQTAVISAATGEGVPELLQRVQALLPLGPMYFPEGMVSDHPDSFLVAELVREQALLKTQQEIPYSLAVVVEEFEPRTEELTYVRAVLYVERESQKKILIGEGGSMLREIGKAARAEAEPLLGKRLYLDLWVKVRPRWRTDESVLARFGYPMPKKPRKRRSR